MGILIKYIMLYGAVSFFASFFLISTTCRIIREKFKKTLDIGNENIAVIVVAVCIFIALVFISNI